jgi:hypothetical protein
MGLSKGSGQKAVIGEPTGINKTLIIVCSTMDIWLTIGNKPTTFTL